MIQEWLQYSKERKIETENTRMMFSKKHVSQYAINFQCTEICILLDHIMQSDKYATGGNP